MKKIDKAIEYATEKHMGQFRKGPAPVPYIKHPLNVANILERVGEKDEVVIAGILHDVLEDTPTTVDEIVKKFGQEIATIVEGVTEKGEGLSWAERLDKYLAKVKASPSAAKKVCVADKIDNMSSMIECLEEGYNIFENMSAGRNEQIAKFNLILETFSNDMSPKLRDLYETTLNKLTKLSAKM